MTYTTPELHLVGSAQHLVLGPESVPNTKQDCQNDDVFLTKSDIVELW